MTVVIVTLVLSIIFFILGTDMLYIVSTKKLLKYKYDKYRITGIVFVVLSLISFIVFQKVASNDNNIFKYKIEDYSNNIYYTNKFMVYPNNMVEFYIQTGDDDFFVKNIRYKNIYLNKSNKKLSLSEKVCYSDSLIKEMKN